MSFAREDTITEAFVSIAKALVDGYDLVDLYSELTADCARILDVAVVGLLLADDRGLLHVVAASSEATRHLDLFQDESEQGPCQDCYLTGSPVLVADLSLERGRWPHFAAAATAAGFASVHALPMRLGDTVLGALGLFGTQPGRLNDQDLRLGQALAHVASVALVAGKAATDKTVVNAQLQTALTSRVILEQAKGILAQLGGLDMDHAFTVLRGYSRDHNRRLSDIAGAVVSRELPPEFLLEHAQAKGAGRPRPPRTPSTKLSAGQIP